MARISPLHGFTCGRSTAYERTKKRRLVRQIRSSERRELITWREDWILERYSSLRAYRSYLRSSRYVTELWYTYQVDIIRERVDCTTVYQCESGNTDEDGEFNSSISLDAKTFVRETVRVKRERRPVAPVKNTHPKKASSVKSTSSNTRTKKKFVPHGGVDTNVVEELRGSNLWNDCTSQLSSIDGKLVKRIEDFILSATKIFLMKDYRLIVLEIISYIKTFSNRSIVSIACSYVVSIFSVHRDAQTVAAVKKLLEDEFKMGDLNNLSDDFMSGEFVAESGVDDFVTAFRTLGDNFGRVRNNPIFKKISYILTACVTLGLCDASNLNWNIAGVRLFSPDAYRKHVDAPSLMAAVMDTVIFFVEGGREFFLNGDFGSLLYSDKRMRKVNDDYNFVMANWDHVAAGNFEKITFLPETEYSCRLDSVIDAVRLLKNGVDKDDQKQLRIMESQLLNIRTQYQTKKTTGGFKRAPFVVCIHGESGMGKSVVQERLMVDLLVALGFNPDPKNVAYYNPYDEYDSSMRGNTIGIFMDEVANTKPDFQTKVPYEFIMRVNNNAKATAVMADLELKNKITIEPEVVIMTTNDATIGAYDCSKNPVSVLRRVHIYLDFKVRPEFKKDGAHMIDPDKVFAVYGDKEIWEVQDVWICDAYEYVGKPNNIKGRADIPDKRYLKDEQGTLEGVGYARIVKHMIDMARKNHKQQTLLVANNGKYHSSVKLCESCNYLHSICQCSKPDVVLQHLRSRSSIGPMVSESGINDHMAPVFKHLAKFWLKAKAKSVMILAYDLPFRIVEWCSPIEYEYLIDKQYVLSCEIIGWKCILNVIILTLIFAIFSLDICLLSFIGMIGIYVYYVFEKRALYQTYLSNKAKGKIFIDIAAITRSKKLQHVLAGSAGIMALYVMFTSIRKAWTITQMMNPHGNIAPSSEEDILQRDNERCAYSKAYIEKPPSTCRQNDTSTPDQVCNTIFKNQMILNVEHNGIVEYCGAIAFDTNIILVPKHMVYRNGIINKGKILFKRHGTDSAGGSFSCYIDETTTHFIPNQDLALLYVPSSGSFANISRLLPQAIYSGSCKLVYKNRDGTRRQEGATVEPAHVKHTYDDFYGYDTMLTDITHRGLCMATFVATCKSPHIVGFHVGGTVAESRHGIATVLLRQHYDEGVKRLKMVNFVTHSAGIFPDEILGKPIIYNEDVHHKSPVHFLENASNMQVHGSCGGGVTFVSRVIPSIISQSVAEHFGVENKWGKPNCRPQWRAWQETMDKFTHGSDGFIPLHLLWAEEDYITPLMKLMKDEFRRKMVRPLLPHEVINGVPGERFIDKMNFSSSIGFPLTGEKRKYLVDVEIEGYNDPKDFTPEIWSEISRCEEAWLRGERAYTPIKAVLKDEPTNVDKTKMRVFYSMNIAVQYHLRRLTLGLARFLSMHPLVSENMVGMNCMSKEWDQWVKYCNSDGFTNCFAGDYKSYDTKMPAQIILSAFKIFKRLMVESGNFTNDDFLIYDGLVSEITYPFIAYNGTMISVSCGHISGNNLTVYVNDVCNSLLKRLGFYEIEVLGCNNPHTFQECERGGNYGDDCKSNVNPSRVTNWNMRTFRDFLLKHGMEFTMPDKSTEMVDFMRWEEAEFLKRTDAYIPEINCIVGKLAADSIFKSLHCVLKSDVLSDTDHALATMDGAAYEFFAFGRETYEDAMEKLRLIALDHQIRPTGIFKTYDMRVEEWKITHEPESLENTSSDNC